MARVITACGLTASDFFRFRFPFGSCIIYVTPYSVLPLPHPHLRPRCQQEGTELFSRRWNSAETSYKSHILGRWAGRTTETTFCGLVHDLQQHIFIALNYNVRKRIFSSPKPPIPPPGPTYPNIHWIPAFFPGDKAAVAWSWPLNLEPRSRMSGAIPLLPFCTFKVWAQTTLWRF